jgi:flagellar capping protein FliD
MSGGPNQIANRGIWIELAKFVLPTVLAMAAGYGSFKASSATLEERMKNNEIRIAELQKQLDDGRSRYVQMDTLKAYLDGIKNQLDSIQRDLRRDRER